MTDLPDSAFHLLQAVVQRAPVGIAFLDSEFRYALINDTLAAINGAPVEHHLGRRVDEIIPHLWPKFHPIYEQVLRESKSVLGLEVTRDENSWLTSYYPVPGISGETIGIGVIATNVTEQKHAERELRRVSEHERAILAALPDLIFELAEDSTHLSFHAPSSEGLLVSPDLFMGKRVRDVLPADVATVYEDAIARTLSAGRMEVFEYELQFPDGITRAFDARMVKKSEDQVLVVVRDVTERRSLEDQFRHAQKMEAIGRLAGGVAHDFNNLLTVINGCTAMAMARAVDDESRTLLREVSDAGVRAATLTRQLLMFSRQQVLEPRILDINEVVEETKQMLLRLIGEDVQLVTKLAPASARARADRGQAEQVLVNLIVNARDAMPGGGVITVSVSHVTLPVSERENDDEIPAGPYVLLSVTDTGVGMDEATRARIFEPFFTTKEPGIGTGLGLPVVLGAMREGGGYVRVRSTPGEGSSFDLYYPAVDARPRDELAPADSPPLSEIPKGYETILLVEDDPSVRAVTARILGISGYTLVVASDGREALALATTHPGPIHLMVSDVAIPHVSGRELAEQIQLIRPGIPVLFISGYTADEVLRRGVHGARVAFLQKPFTAKQLAIRVRERLDSLQ